MERKGEKPEAEMAERTVCRRRDDPAVLPEKPSERKKTGRADVS